MSIRQVLATEDRRFAAMVHADTVALEQLLAPDLTYTHSDGAQNTRAEFLQIVGTGALRYESIAPETREVRVFGSSAVVTGRSAMRVASGAQGHAFRIRYLAVYRHGARGWELIAWQSTRLDASESAKTKPPSGLPARTTTSRRHQKCVVPHSAQPGSISGVTTS